MIKAKSILEFASVLEQTTSCRQINYLSCKSRKIQDIYIAKDLINHKLLMS